MDEGTIELLNKSFFSQVRIARIELCHQKKDALYPYPAIGEVAWDMP